MIEKFWTPIFRVRTRLLIPTFRTNFPTQKILVPIFRPEIFSQTPIFENNFPTSKFSTRLVLIKKIGSWKNRCEKTVH